MSFAWPTVALLVALLPGFLFFVGLPLTENFTRETTPRNPLGQLATVVLVAAAVHILAYWVVGTLSSWPWTSVPSIRLDYVLATFGLDNRNRALIEEIAGNIGNHYIAIASYIAFTSLAGLLIGYAFGKGIVRDWRIRFWPFPIWFRFRRLAQHDWVYDLPLARKQGFTFAYVMSRVKNEDRVLLYRGRLKQFGLGDQGKFSYIVLTLARRFCMSLDDTLTTTGAVRIGQSRAPAAEPIVSYLTIEGEDIANALFNSYGLALSPEEVDALLGEPSTDVIRTRAPGIAAEFFEELKAALELEAGDA